MKVMNKKKILPNYLNILLRSLHFLWIVLALDLLKLLSSSSLKLDLFQWIFFCNWCYLRRRQILFSWTQPNLLIGHKLEYLYISMYLFIWFYLFYCYQSLNISPLPHYLLREIKVIRTVSLNIYELWERSLILQRPTFQ